MFATTQPKVLMTVGSSWPSTQSCLPLSSFNQHRPAIQLLSSSPPTINIVPAYFTIPAPQRAFGSSGPGDQVLVSGSNTSTELTQNSGRYSFFHLSLIAPLPPGKNKHTVKVRKINGHPKKLLWAFRLLPYFMCANSKGSGELRGCAGLLEHFGRTLRLLPYFMCANSKGSGELSGCAGLLEHSLVAYVISTITSWGGSIISTFEQCGFTTK